MPSAICTDTDRSPSPSAAEFLRGLAARSAALIAPIVLLNVLVDPFGIYGIGPLAPIVLQTRGPKLALYDARQPPPDIVILGSSRSFTVEPGYVAARTGRTAFNAAVHGGSLRDMLDFSRCFAARGSFPSMLILGVGVEHARWLGATTDEQGPLIRCSRPAEALAETLKRGRDLFSLDGTRASFRSLALAYAGRPEPVYTFDADGAVRGPWTREHAGHPTLERSLTGGWGPTAFPEGEPAPERLAELREILDLSRRHQAQVLLYLPPYHPRAVALYVSASRFGALRARLLERLREWAPEYPRLRVYDFSEVARFGGREDMFLDTIHPDSEAHRLMVDLMLAGAR